MNSTKRTLRIGTRESKLALLQTDMVLEALRKITSDFEFEIVAQSTSGDKVQNKPLHSFGGTGVFVKELEDALLNNEADLVVHSLKDLPTELPAGLMLAATLLRDDPRDAYVSAKNVPLTEAAPGARIATSSRRRAAQIAAMRSDVTFVDVRGNVPTRLRKMEEGHCDGMILAAAGLLRLGYGEKIVHYLDVEHSVPAAGQGALAVECRSNDTGVVNLLKKINDAGVWAETSAERAFLKKVGGGCSVPIGVLGRLDTKTDKLTLTACISDGERLAKATISGTSAEATELGIKLADEMLTNEAADILQKIIQRPQQAISPP